MFFLTVPPLFAMAFVFFRPGRDPRSCGELWEFGLIFGLMFVGFCVDDHIFWLSDEQKIWSKWPKKFHKKIKAIFSARTMDSQEQQAVPYDDERKRYNISNYPSPESFLDRFGSAPQKAKHLDGVFIVVGRSGEGRWIIRPYLETHEITCGYNIGGNGTITQLPPDENKKKKTNNSIAYDRCTVTRQPHIIPFNVSRN